MIARAKIQKDSNVLLLEPTFHKKAASLYYMMYVEQEKKSLRASADELNAKSDKDVTRPAPIFGKTFYDWETPRGI